MKRPLWVLAGALLGAIVALLVVATLLAALFGGLVGGFLGGLAGAAAARRAAGREPEAGPAEPPPDEATTLLQSLLGTNITARVEAFPAEVTTVVERVVDKLRALVPEANERYPGNPLTWEVNQSAREYLPRLVARYAALAPPQRAEQAEQAVASMAGLEEALDRAGEVMRSHREDEFAVAARFLSARFGEQL